MARTFDEMLELIADNIDEITLLEVLEINSYDLVANFQDKIQTNIDKFNGLEDEVDDNQK